jgi:hypothetical protein
LTVGSAGAMLSFVRPGIVFGPERLFFRFDAFS